jgi:transposase
MPRYKPEAWRGKHLFVGIDLHLKKWHVTILREDGLTLFSNSIDGSWPALQGLLGRFFEASKISVVYEAGYFGFWLYDRLMEYGVEARVTPPNLIPTAAGDRVKTDRIDSAKLARRLRSDELKAVYVPTKEERAHRQVARRRRQLVEDRVRVQSRIKAHLRVNGVELPQESVGKWSLGYVDKLYAFRFEDRFEQESFKSLLEQYDFLSDQIGRQEALLRELSRSPKYEARVEILKSVPGIGWLSAMEVLLELQDVERFHSADALAAYVGLTPSQYSSGEKVRFGRITAQGKPTVRALLIRSAWSLIKKDALLQEKYQKLKVRAGAKRAIVAIARILVIRIRSILISKQPYAFGLV